MNTVTCAEVRATAAEFAFGLGDGVARAEIVAHLDVCSACGRHVEELTASADALLIGGPVTEPPAGFEERIARAIANQPSDARRHRFRRRVLAAAAMVLAVFGTAIVAGRLADGGTSEAAVRSAAMVTTDGRTVGRVAVGADPDTVFVALPGWRPRGAAGQTEPYRLRLVLSGGRSQLVGPVHLGGGDGSWGTVLAVDARDVRRVALVGDRGHEYCAGVLG